MMLTMETIKSKILHGRKMLPEEPIDLSSGINRYKAENKKKELKQLIEDLGSWRDNKFSIRELERKQKYVDDHFEEMCQHPEKMEEFEWELGLPISYSAWAVVCLS